MEAIPYVAQESERDPETGPQMHVSVWVDRDTGDQSGGGSEYQRYCQEKHYNAEDSDL
jgi:hypothetical protein